MDEFGRTSRHLETYRRPIVISSMCGAAVRCASLVSRERQVICLVPRGDNSSQIIRTVLRPVMSADLAVDTCPHPNRLTRAVSRRCGGGRRSWTCPLRASRILLVGGSAPDRVYRLWDAEGQPASGGTVAHGAHRSHLTVRAADRGSGNAAGSCAPSRALEERWENLLTS